ncbi:MAG TPA: nucleotidyltransferase [Clostridiales bacterium]|nr:nucleotidyltransferase [Clostridiales bacterium]
MKKTTLVIMAAGMGSRYGGVKQLDPVGPSGEIIMDYSVYDAISAGFNKVVFIIRKELEKDFREVIGDKFSKNIEVDYVFQELDDLPDGIALPEGRTKPWGTGQAVLSCKGVVNEPFAVINADDYYGKEAFVKIHDYLVSLDSGEDKYAFCMAGFVLANTLSDNGTVTRGICKVDEEGILIDVNETADLIQVGELVEGSDLITDEEVSLDINSVVSMNMWGFTPELLEELDAGFKSFLKDHGSQLKTEYLLPDVIADLIKEDKAKVKVLSTKDKWFGVTYKEDKKKVMESFQELIDKGLYPKKLF